MKYLNDSWKTTLDAMGLKSFDDWWTAEGERAEKANTVPGKPDTWSHVTILKTPEGKSLFLKRQQDFHPNNIIQKWQKQLTFTREYESYQKIKSANVPTYDLICYDTRKHDGHHHAIYVAEGLDDYISLYDLINEWNTQGWPDRQARRKFLQPLVQTTRHMHQHGILHNALNPRHIYVNVPLDSPYDIPESPSFKLIDFEGVKAISPGSDKAITRDLFSLHRRSKLWPNNDRIWFLKKYLNIEKLDPKAKSLIRKITNKVNKLK